LSSTAPATEGIVIANTPFPPGGLRYLTLEIGLERDDHNRVRFPAPVPVGSRIRGHVRLVSAEQKQAGLESAFGVLVELEGSDRSACVIETVVIYR